MTLRTFLIALAAVAWALTCLLAVNEIGERARAMEQITKESQP